ncbi:polysaccharide pyruvyl transferase family protein [Candidatus Bathyarchaeota archaeon]|nr:polysaccharide pyruvyl transferase family protein [Candidatus Bathyarchaeota archaeon]
MVGDGLVPSVLLVGYNGANNTGSEARLLSIIDDVRSIVGSEALITVPTLNEKNLRRYISESQTLKISSLPSIFHFSLKRLVSSHDLIMLVEGSCYMDTWSPILLSAFLLATKWAHESRKPSLAYAVDSGHLSPKNKRRVQKEASKTDLIIMRTQSAVDRLKKIDVKTAFEVTADTAFCFEPKTIDEQLLLRVWPETAQRGTVGLAIIDPYCWPVVFRPWGHSRDCYRWPYYFSRSKERSQAAELLAKNLAAEADRIVEEHRQAVVLLCMESLDEPMAKRVLGNMRNKNWARIISSAEYNTSQMTSVLRSLQLVISMRYHACVLSMAAGVPMIGIGHDLRVRDLFSDLGMLHKLYFSTDSASFSELSRRVDVLFAQHSKYQNAVIEGYKTHLSRAKLNKRLLRNFLIEKGFKVMV